MQHQLYRVITDNDSKPGGSSSVSSPAYSLSRVPVPQTSSPYPSMTSVYDPHRRRHDQASSSASPPSSPPAIPPRSLARPSSVMIPTRDLTPPEYTESPAYLVATCTIPTLSGFASCAGDSLDTANRTSRTTTPPLRRRGEVKECKICFEEFEWISLLQLQNPEVAPPSPPSPPFTPEEDFEVEDDAVDWGTVEFDLAEQQMILQEIQRQQQQQQRQQQQPSASSSTGHPLDHLSMSSSTTSSSSSLSFSHPNNSSLSSRTSSLEEATSPSPSSFSSSSPPPPSRPLFALPSHSTTAPPASSSSHRQSMAAGTKSRNSLSSLFAQHKIRSRTNSNNDDHDVYDNNNGNGQTGSSSKRSIVDLPIFKYSAFRVGRPDPPPSRPRPLGISVPPPPLPPTPSRAITFPLSPAFSSSPSSPAKTSDALKLGGALPCGQDHLFCFECLSRHVATQVQARAWPVLCPAENCREAIEDPFLIEMFLGRDANLWHSTAVEYAVKDKIYCPQKKCAQLIDGGGDHSREHLREVNCPYCDYQFCALCSDKSHSGMTCEAVKASKETKEADLAFEKLAAEHKWKQCPGCKHMVEKTQGIPNFRHWSIALCSSVWPPVASSLHPRYRQNDFKGPLSILSLPSFAMEQTVGCPVHALNVPLVVKHLEDHSRLIPLLILVQNVMHWTWC